MKIRESLVILLLLLQISNINSQNEQTNDNYKNCVEMMKKYPNLHLKCNLLISLSHNAKIIILDEPTSGLDPFSRDELLDVFSQLKQNGVAIFFSTHIISDIEKCADNIIYISNGKIVASLPKDDFMTEYSKNGESLEEAILRMERGVNNA